jgi:threonine dehydratase
MVLVTEPISKAASAAGAPSRRVPAQHGARHLARFDDGRLHAGAAAVAVEAGREHPLDRVVTGGGL